VLKNELDKHNIKFQILNLDAKIPTMSCIILTTSEDDIKVNAKSQNNYLVYLKNSDFKKYLIKVLAAHRITYKEIYSTLTFSIDPGKKLGLMIFLDDFYLNSYCCFEKPDLIKIINKFYETFQECNPDLMDINFKLGSGVLNITFELVEEIYRIFQGRTNVWVYLIDEFKSSKIKLSRKKVSRKISKDEISALILAFRNGIEVNQDNYHFIFEQIKNKTLKIDNFNTLVEDNHENYLLDLKEMIVEVLNGDITLSNAIKMLNINNP